MKRTLSVLVAMTFASSAFAAPTAAAGKAIYTANCAGCHGANAKGMPNLGVSLKDASKWKHEIFKRALVQGKDEKGMALKPMMPKFAKGFAPKVGKAPTDEQIKSLQLYIKSLKP